MQEKETREKAEQDLFRKFAKNLAAREPLSGEDRDRLLLERAAKSKVLKLDQLAFDLQVTTKELVARIEAMVSSGKLGGIFDDRGMFI